MPTKPIPPYLSFVVPVFNDAANLKECLTAIAQSAPSNSEIIVVDDASTAEAATVRAVAKELGARFYRLKRNAGPAAARNHGALQARGNILFFVDADVVISPEVVAGVGDILKENSGVDAVFGSYDRCPRAPGLVSQFRNLLHHFFHQSGARDASTFWAGCGAIRREVFFDLGGFNERRFQLPSIEDVELGFRLKRAGKKILLDKTLQVTHLKKWTFCSMIRTDIKHRAIPWSHLILETGQLPNELNLKSGQRISAALVGLAALSLVCALFRTEIASLAAANLAGVLLLNRKLYACFAQARGVGFAIACIPLHLSYYVCCGTSFLYVWGRYFLPDQVSEAPVSMRKLARRLLLTLY